MTVVDPESMDTVASLVLPDHFSSKEVISVRDGKEISAAYFEIDEKNKDTRILNAVVVPTSLALIRSNPTVPVLKELARFKSSEKGTLIVVHQNDRYVRFFMSLCFLFNVALLLLGFFLLCFNLCFVLLLVVYCGILFFIDFAVLPRW